jgi:hypothetical protein
MIERRIVVNDTISQYIQQQMEAARLERQRQTAAFEAKEARELQERKAISLKNTLRALALIGIEATESNLECTEEGFYSLVVDTVRISLKIASNYDYGKINELEELDYMPSDYDKSKGKSEYHDVRFTLHMSIINNSIDSGADWDISDYCEYKVHHRGAYKVSPERLPQADIPSIFELILQLKERLQVRAQFTPAPRTESSAPKTPRFSYTGDSREEILAHVLRDIQADYYPEVEF